MTPDVLRVVWLDALRRKESSPADDLLDAREQEAFDAYVDRCTELGVEPQTASG